MLTIELDKTQGGRSVLRVIGEAHRPGDRLAYLNVVVHAMTANGGTVEASNVFLGATREEWQQLAAAIEQLKEVADAEGPMLEGLW